jgi:hypothetical protein
VRLLKRLEDLRRADDLALHRALDYELRRVLGELRVGEERPAYTPPPWARDEPPLTDEQRRELDERLDAELARLSREVPIELKGDNDAPRG